MAHATLEQTGAGAGRPPVAPGEAAGDQELGPLLQPRFEHPAFPWKQVVGYVGSLVLTLIALDLVVDRLLPLSTLVPVILGLAVLQAAWQLGFFMHLREARGPVWHVLLLALGIGVAVLLVAFSIWIMTFKFGVS